MLREDGDGMSIDWRRHDRLPRRARRPAAPARAVPDRLPVQADPCQLRFILNGWFVWCRRIGHHALEDADPRLIERWITDMQHRLCAANTIAARVSAASAKDRADTHLWIGRYR
jgi:hypothetical protein